MQYEIPYEPKLLRETLCIAQSTVASSKLSDLSKLHHLTVLQHVINECTRHRPLGPDGKHGNRHTPTCGCEDK